MDDLKTYLEKEAGNAKWIRPLYNRRRSDLAIEASIEQLVGALAMPG